MRNLCMTSIVGGMLLGIAVVGTSVASLPVALASQGDGTSKTAAASATSDGILTADAEFCPAPAIATQDDMPKYGTEDPLNTKTANPETNGSDANKQTNSSSTTEGTKATTSSTSDEAPNPSAPDASTVAEWGTDSPYIESIRQRGTAVGSGTEWLCVVDKQNTRTVIFKRDGSGQWDMVKAFDTAQGRIQADGQSRTFSGTWKIDHKARALYDDAHGINCNDWWVCFVPAWTSDSRGKLRYYEGKGYDDGQGFHVTYGGLKQFNLAGCTGLSYENAKWVYDNVPIGTTVLVF